jgi:uncharacterized protein YkwD
MPRTGKPARAIVAAILLSLTILTSSSAFVPASAATLRTRMMREINEIRQRRDLREVKLAPRLSRKAKRHSRAMVRKNQLFHTPNLSKYMSRRSLTPWGENVGCGGTVRRLMRAFMRSKAHRSTILTGRYRKVGVGVVQARRRNMCGRRSVWATQVFYGR